MVFNPFQETLIDSSSNADSIKINTPYYSINQFLELNIEDFSIFHLNIRSLQKNFESFKLFLSSSKTNFDVICLSETWCDDLVSNNSLFHLPDYTLFEQPRTSGKRGGGVLIYVSDVISSTVRTKFNVSTNYTETLFIELSFSNCKNIIVGIVYRPPNGKYDIFKKHLKSVIKKVNQEQKIICVAGDFNINALTYDSFPKTKSFFDMLFKHNTISVINRPTRVTRTTATAIDNILTNNFLEGKFSSGIIKTDISDHFSVFYSFNLSKNTSDKETKTILKRNISNKNVDNFRLALRNASWDGVLLSNDANAAFNNFHNQFVSIFDKTCPVNEVKLKSKNLVNPWFDKALTKCSRKKQRLYNKFLKNRTFINETNYKNYKYKFNRLMFDTKRNYYKDKLNKYKDDTKRTWSIINELTGRKLNIRNDLPKTIHINKQCFVNKKDIADKLNKYFVNVGPDLAKNIPLSDTSFHDYLTRYEVEMQDANISMDDLKNAFQTLKRNKAPGYDDVTSNVILSVIDEIVTPLYHSIKLSFQSGIFPNKLKVAKISPVFKKDDRCNLSNYRPISVLTVFSKLYEKLMYNNLYSHFSSNRLLYKRQFGFPSNCSTEHAIVDLVNHLKMSLDKNLYSIGVFLDLSKAFDTVNHEILLAKLKYYGVNKLTHSWITDYLKNRKQFITYGSSQSTSLEEVLCGVPQGSILGPLLFLIYINDIFKSLKYTKSVMFADDTNLVYSHSDIKTLFKKTNEDLVTIDKWFRANKISLNTNKTKYIFFHNRNQRDNIPLKLPNLQISSNVIERVSHLKFLGLIIDENLSWNQHIKKLETQIAKTIGMMYKVRPFLNENCLKQLYFSLIHSHLTYANIGWASNFETKLSKLFSLQKHACRIILYKNKMHHAKPLMKKLNMLSIHDINIYQHLVFMYKYKSNSLPQIFSEYFSLVSNERYNLRSQNSSNFNVCYLRKKKSDFCISSRGPLIWNSFNEVLIKEAKSDSSFKYLTKKKLLLNYV